MESKKKTSKKIEVASTLAGDQIEQSAPKELKDQTPEEIAENYTFSIDKRKNGLLAGEGMYWAVLNFRHEGKDMIATTRVKSTLRNQNKKTIMHYFNGLYLAQIEKLKGHKPSIKSKENE